MALSAADKREIEVLIRKEIKDFVGSNTMKQFETKSCSKVSQKYFCESCDYNTSKKSSFDKHLSTSKHLNETKVKQNETK